MPEGHCRERGERKGPNTRHHFESQGFFANVCGGRDGCDENLCGRPANVCRDVDRRGVKDENTGFSFS